MSLSHTLPTNETKLCEDTNLVTGPCSLFSDQRQAFVSKLAKFDPTQCAIYFYQQSQGSLKPFGRGEVVVNAYNRNHTSMENSAAAHSHRKHTLEIQVLLPDNDVASVVEGAMNPLSNKKPANGLWQKAKKAAEIKVKSIYLAFSSSEELSMWYSTIKFTIRSCRDCTIIYSAATIESSFSWINSNLNKIAKANETKIGAIGNNHSNSSIDPSHTGTDLLELLQRFDNNRHNIDAIGKHVLRTVSNASGFLNFRRPDTEIQQMIHDLHNGDHLAATHLFKYSFVCGNSSAMAKLYSLLASGSTDRTPDKAKVSWNCVKFNNPFAPHNKTQEEVEGVLYKTVSLFLEVELPGSVDNIILECNLHLRSMLECIKSSTNNDDSPLSLYADHHFTGPNSDIRELIFRHEVYLQCGTTRRLEKMELRPFYIKEIEYIHVKEIGLRKESFKKEIDKQLIEASLDLALATILRRHYTALTNTPMMETKVLPLLSFVEETRGNQLGRSHPLTLQAVNSMALTLRKMRRYDEAEAAYNRSLKALHKNVGTNDAKTASIYHNLGILLQLKGDIARAIEYFEKDVEILTAVHGVSHPDTLSCVKHLIKICNSSSKFKSKAAKYKDLSMRGNMKAHGGGSLEHLEAVHQNAESLIEHGKSAEAAVALQEALAAFDKRAKVKGEEADVLNARLSCLNNLGVALLMENDIAGATQRLQQCATGYASSREYGPSHASTVMVMNNLGMLLAAQEKFQEAEGCYRRALRGVLPYFEQTSSPAMSSFGHKKNVKLAKKSPAEMQQLEEAVMTLKSNLAQVSSSLDEKVSLYRNVLRYTEKKVKHGHLKSHNHPDYVLALQNLTAALVKKCKAEPDVTQESVNDALSYVQNLVDLYERRPGQYTKELRVFKDILAKGIQQNNSI
mmetsp:Transcript_23745/g.49478  ORF Transcript_23745/g.49478 Transcript_23745/m.49478 type:complete len:905 (-) Transcript_23745:9-2723(-)